MSRIQNLLIVFDSKEPWKPYHDKALQKIEALGCSKLCMFESKKEELMAGDYHLERELEELLEWTDRILFLSLSCQTVENVLKMNLTDSYADLLVTALSMGKKIWIMDHFLNGVTECPFLTKLINYWKSSVEKLMLPIVSLTQIEDCMKGINDQIYIPKQQKVERVDWMTEADVIEWAKAYPGEILQIGRSVKLTPLAFDKAKELSLEVRDVR